MRLFVTAFVLAALSPAALAQTTGLPYQNPALSPEQRAHDLVSRMTLEEKVGQMGNHAHAVPRLDVPAYDYWNEALHGVARSGYATMFPQAIGMAATWDAPLLHSIGDVIATEARAKNNEALRHNNHDIYFGLTFWSPNINIFRDPRWGRGQETYGEDPFLTGTLGMNFVHGLQGDDPRFYKVIATPKHFAVHSGPEAERHRFNVDPTPHDLWDTYLPQFRMAIVDGKADSIMCAYNAVDGQPACGSKLLLVDVLRQDWGFKGFVTSDCGAIGDFFEPRSHQTQPDAEHAAAAALLAGTDTNCGPTYEKLGAAVHAGLIKEADIDHSLERLFEARMRLGLFDPTASVPYAQIPYSAVHSPANAAVARRAAEESMVLLKNDGILPLAPGKYKTIAVIGPDAASLSSIEGNYHGVVRDPSLPVDALQTALRTALPGVKMLYQAGAPFVEGFSMPVPRTMLHPAEHTEQLGLKAEYFAGTALSGTPVQTRVDPEVDFDWNGVSPLRSAPNSPFAVRWSGFVSAPAPGSYQFTLRPGDCDNCTSSQGFRVLIDDRQIAGSAPQTGAPTMGVDPITGLPQEISGRDPLKFALSFSEGQQHRIVIEFIRSATANKGSGLSLQWTPPASALLPAALQAAKQADLVIAMLGLSPNLEGEEMPVALPGFAGGDRTDVALPAAQEQLLEQLVATGKPTVVVLLNGSALAVNFADAHARALLEAWYPGEAGAQAIVDTLTGTNNPSGRLPVTFYKSTADLPAFTDYSMKNRTYRYFTGTPLYGFGYGLSYTSFAYSHLRLSSPQLQAGDNLTVEAEVKNTGRLAGDELAEMYLTPPTDGNGGLSPRLQLGGFERVHLAPGETKHLRFTLAPRQLSVVDAQGERAVQPGSYTLSVGGSQPKDAHAPEPAQTAHFRITGTQQLPH